MPTRRFVKGLTDPQTYPAEANEALLFRIARELGGRSVEEWAQVMTAHELVRWVQYDLALETARRILKDRSEFRNRIESMR